MTGVMHDRGQPLGDFDDRVRALSVEHADTLDQYRQGHAISQANERGEASAEQLRQGFMHHRALAAQLLGTGDTPCRRHVNRQPPHRKADTMTDHQMTQWHNLDRIQDEEWEHPPADSTRHLVDAAPNAPKTRRQPATAEQSTVDQAPRFSQDNPSDQTGSYHAEAQAGHVNGGGRGNAGMAADREATRAPSDGQLPPGASAADPVAALWGADRVAHYRDRWKELQLRFVENPDRATSDAAALLDDAVQTFTSSLNEQKHALDAWQSGDDGDTERMRVAIQRYRAFLDRLLGM